MGRNMPPPGFEPESLPVSDALGGDPKGSAFRVRGQNDSLSLGQTSQIKICHGPDYTTGA
jgi:hypothetical protein